MTTEAMKKLKVTQIRQEQAVYEGSVTVGKDILELLSSSMYVNPLTIYREYVQNASDAIDEAVGRGVLASSSDGRVDVALDHIGRRAVVRDNGIGINRDEFAARMTAFGASQKRGTTARGFRGVGRLAGLGYCQELIFRSREKSNSKICEVKWDCRSLKQLLADQHFEGSLEDVVRQIVNVREFSDVDYPDRFFEVEIVKPKRLGKDLLLNEIEIQSYLSQVSPCPFNPNFSFGDSIREALKSMNVQEYNLYLNGSDTPIYKPYADEIVYSDTKIGRPRRLQEISIDGIEGEVAAVGWILHHDYQGALPSGLGIRGLRARVGNIQVGNERIFAEVFPEERFCSWTLGEIHLTDARIIPNGRRDNFEPNTHISNVTTHLLPFASEVAKECRSSSQLRNRLKIFDLGEQKVLEKIELIEQGVISRGMANTLKKEVGTHLAEIKKVINSDLIDEKDQKALHARASDLVGQIAAVSDNLNTEDPLASLPKNKRGVYMQVFDLIYQCSVNHIAAKSLVDRILGKISIT